MNFQGPAEINHPVAVDFYSTLHKGLRRVLFKVAVNLAAVDPDNSASVIRILGDLHAMLKLMGRLGGAEVTHVHEFLDRVRPGAAQAARADSARQALAVGALLRLEAEARQNRGRLRAELLAALNANLAAFIGEALLHMADAEVELMPLLCESASEAELGALQQQILADLGTETVLAMTREVVRAVSVAERQRFLQALEKFAPAEALPSIWSTVNEVLMDDAASAPGRTIGDECARMSLVWSH